MSVKNEYDNEMERRNFTRAVMLAEDANLGEEAVAAAKRAAIKQAVGEWFNFRGAESLAHQWDVPKSEVSEICDEILAEYADRREKEGRVIQVFDIDRMDHTPVTTLISHFRDNFR